MGYIAHNAILITGMLESVEKIHAKAMEIFGTEAGVSSFVASYTNHYISFFVAPDGSKEGWDESNNGDERRNEFVKYLTKSNDSRHGPFCYWVEVRYDENDKKEIVR